jgi:RNA polymerase sigma-70 factor, ECF subfamily
MATAKSAIYSGKAKLPTVAPESREHAERNLLDAARAGESTAFGALCARHLQQLNRAALRITRNREDAEDAVQDALLNAFVHIANFDARSSFATWLTRIAINSALMILRKRRSLLGIATEGMDEFGMEGPAHQVADHEPDPESRYAQKEEKKILSKAIQKLRPKLRQIVTVHQLGERSVGETAKALDISVGAAKSRLFHAKAALRKSRAVKLMYQRPRPAYGMRVLSAA